MNKINKRDEPGRLEDFIQFARKGNRIAAKIGLRKQSMIQNIATDETDGKSDNIKTYLLIADFTFTVSGRSHEVSKVYMFAVATESADATRANTAIANLRLQIDYERLKAVNISFTEKFF
jgi:hypothetical protein